MIKKIITLSLIIFIAYSTLDADNDKVNNINEIDGAYKGPFYSGNLEASNEVKLQYWFFPQNPEPEEGVVSPLLLWLNSGPGCSFIIDAVGGNGPFVINGEGVQPIFKTNGDSWNDYANILYIDSPGVGFSTLPKDYGELRDSQVIEYVYEGLTQWFKRFPEYKTNDLYIAGSGYGGTYALLLNEFIYNQNALDLVTDKFQIRGSLIGNPVVSSSQVFSKEKKHPYHFLEFLISMGIYDYTMMEDFGKKCGFEYDKEKVETEECKEVISTIQRDTYGLNTRDINADCEIDAGEGNEYDCIDSLEIDEFLNKYKKELHVADEAQEFLECRKDIVYAQGTGSIFAAEKLIRNGQRLTVLQGDADAEVPFHGTYKWISELRDLLGLADIVSYTSWFYYPENKLYHLQNAGSYWRMDGMQYVSFKSCGMDIARCNPQASGLMFKNFINRVEMCTIPDLCEKPYFDDDNGKQTQQVE